MLTKKDYCGYELIVELEQLGMPIKIDFACGIENGQLVKTKFYPNPPSLYEVQKWLREEKKIEVNATYDNIIELHWHWYMKSLTNRNQDISIINYDSYEQALLAGIKEAIEILKKENND